VLNLYPQGGAGQMKIHNDSLEFSLAMWLSPRIKQTAAVGSVVDGFLPKILAWGAKGAKWVSTTSAWIFFTQG